MKSLKEAFINKRNLSKVKNSLRGKHYLVWPDGKDFGWLEANRNAYIQRVEDAIGTYLYIMDEEQLKYFLKVAKEEETEIFALEEQFEWSKIMEIEFGGEEDGTPGIVKLTDEELKRLK